MATPHLDPLANRTIIISKMAKTIPTGSTKVRVDAKLAPAEARRCGTERAYTERALFCSHDAMKERRYEEAGRQDVVLQMRGCRTTVLSTTAKYNDSFVRTLTNMPRLWSKHYPSQKLSLAGQKSPFHPWVQTPTSVISPFPECVIPRCTISVYIVHDLTPPMAVLIPTAPYPSTLSIDNMVIEDIFDAGALRSTYRDSISKLPDSSVHRKIIDHSTIVEPCLICLQNGDIGVEMVMLRCECPYWGHESCMAKSVFETGGCPTCRAPQFSFDTVELLSTACIHGDIEKARHLLESGTYHSTRDIIDGTPLIRAAQHGHREVIHLLMEHGASITQEDVYHQTAICWASKEGHKDAVEELLLAGGDISYLDSKGQTLLHLAVKSGSEETAALLLARGVVGSVADLEGVTALHLAAKDGSKGFINLLIDNGAETAAKDNLGRTPLHCCAELGYGAATKLLVDRGSSLSAKDKAGRTARELAQEAGRDRSVRALDGEPSSITIVEGRVVFL